MHASTHDHDNRAQRVGIAVALALHGVAIAALLSCAPVRRALADAAPVMVSYLIAPSPPAPAPDVLPKPLPVKPMRALPPRPTVPEPLLAVDAHATAPTSTPVPEVRQPLPPIQEAAPAPPAAPAPQAPITPPSFNAAYLDNPPPAYPALARRSGEQGRVLLRVLVNAAGGADTVELRTSSGSPRLDHAALDTVKRWRFVPARQGDLPVAAWVLVPINFTLEN